MDQSARLAAERSADFPKVAYRSRTVVDDCAASDSPNDWHVRSICSDGGLTRKVAVERRKATAHTPDLGASAVLIRSVSG